MSELGPDEIRQLQMYTELMRPDLAEAAAVDKLNMVINDENLVKELEKAGLEELKPLASHLLSVTFFNKREAEAKKHRIAMVCCLKELFLDEESYNPAAFIKMEAARIPLEARLNDSIDGRKLQIAMKSVKAIEVVEQRRRRI